MINPPQQDQRRRLAHAYKTLRRTIYWAKHAARAEWHHDNCRYPLRNYYKHGTLEDIKAAWFLRSVMRHQNASWDDATINFAAGVTWPFPYSN